MSNVIEEASDLFDRFPLRRIGNYWSKLAGSINGIVSAFVTAGLISTAQGDSVIDLFTNVDSLWGAVSGVFAAGGTVWSAFRTSRDGEKQVTPSSDPRDSEGNRLVVDAAIREDEQPRDEHGRFTSPDE